MKNYILVIGCFILLGWGCKKKKAPEPPAQAFLIFPLKSSECNTGNDVDDNLTEVTFKWDLSKYTESYELRVNNLTTNITQTIAVKKTSAVLSLEKGQPYAWQVISKNSMVPETATSETWHFFNAGTQTEHAPFPVSDVVPKSGVSVVKDVNNEVSLTWSGSDVDDDIQGYDVYFGMENPPEEIVVSTSESTIKVSVVSDTSYYWKVVTKDKKGNTSDSGVFLFKVI